jgi:hypothetical protein
VNEQLAPVRPRQLVKRLGRSGDERGLGSILRVLSDHERKLPPGAQGSGDGGGYPGLEIGNGPPEPRVGQ